MPEVRDDQAGPLSISIDSAADRTDDFNLPRAIVERFGSSVETPAPLLVLGIVEECVELVGPAIAGVWEPTHRNQVAVGRLNDTSLAQTLLPWHGWLGLAATDLRENARSVFLPCVASVFGPGWVLAAEVEDPSFLRCGEVVFAAVSAFLIAEDRPTGVAPSLVCEWGGDIEVARVGMTGGIVDVDHIAVPIGNRFPAAGG